MRGDFTGLRSQRLAPLLQLPCALAPGPSSLARPAAGPCSIVTGRCPWVRPPSGSGAGLQGREAAGWGLQKGFEVLGGGGAAEDPERLVRLLDRVGGVQGLRGTAAGIVGGVSLCSRGRLAAGGLSGPVVCIWRPVGPLCGSHCPCQLQGTGPRGHGSFSERNQTPELGSD